MKELTADLGTSCEDSMYPTFEMISDITTTQYAQTRGGSSELPPQPYVNKVDSVKGQGRWIKTPEAEAYSPKHSSEICAVDTHSTPVEGLSVEEKCVGPFISLHYFC